MIILPSLKSLSISKLLCRESVSHFTLYLDLHIYQFKDNKNHLILWNVSQMSCSIVSKQEKWMLNGTGI